jgi:hypothetical protein
VDEGSEAFRAQRIWFASSACVTLPSPRSSRSIRNCGGAFCRRLAVSAGRCASISFGRPLMRKIAMDKSYAGTDPFALAHFTMVPGRTALVVVDMQNDFLHAKGWYAQQGIDIAHMQAAIEPTRSLVLEARSRGGGRSSGPATASATHATRGFLPNCAPSSTTAACAREAGVTRSSPTAARRRRTGMLKNNVSLLSTARTWSLCCAR